MAQAMFHLSIPIREIESTRRFYCDVLGARATRIAPDRIDLEFFGHHVVCQLHPRETEHRSAPIGKPPFPLRHFGVIVPPPEFDALVARMKAAGTTIAYGPERIFVGTPRDQVVIIFEDPSGNCVEVKGIENPANVFATN